RIIAAMNPAIEEGRRPLSPALRSRWREIWVDEVTDRRELESLVQHKLGRTDDVQITRPKDLGQPEGETENFSLRTFLVQLHRQLVEQFPDQGFSLRELLRLTTFVAGEGSNLGFYSVIAGLRLIYGYQLNLAKQDSFSTWLVQQFGSIAAPSLK